MASAATTTNKTGRTARATKPVSAADRIKTPSFKPTDGVTRAQIRKAVRDVIAKRPAQPQQG